MQTYNRQQIHFFIVNIFNEIDTTIGSAIAIPTGTEGKAYVITKSPNFWACWMKLKERISGDRNVKFYIDHFHCFHTNTQFEEPTIKEVQDYLTKYPTRKFYLSINYRTKRPDDPEEGERENRTIFEVPLQ